MNMATGFDRRHPRSVILIRVLVTAWLLALTGILLAYGYWGWALLTLAGAVANIVWAANAVGLPCSRVPSRLLPIVPPSLQTTVDRCGQLALHRTVAVRPTGHLPAIRRKPTRVNSLCTAATANPLAPIRLDGAGSRPEFPSLFERPKL